ncbi:unnamed protein product [Moneuplotes crassus]|uniref:Uncharacterized protein n=1 Tax=Euplotes crassus TaxID=5936 RepID=A0AAD1U4A7_EUPCR|nr:unnamed protein product [Moneuplotes crassus]
MSQDSSSKKEEENGFINENNKVIKILNESQDPWSFDKKAAGRKRSSLRFPESGDSLEDSKFDKKANLEDHQDVIHRKKVSKTKDNLGPQILERFKEGSGNKIQQAFRGMVVKKIVEKEEYSIHFNLMRAIKMMFYHLLFFATGIFCAFFLILIEGYQFTRNLGFIGTHWWIVVPQYSLQLFFIGFLAIVVFLPTKSLTHYETGILVYSVIARCFIIAVRYGFMSITRFKLYKSKATFSWILHDLLLLGWLKMTPESLKEQITATKNRVKILEEDWNFIFIETLPIDLHNRLLDLDNHNQENYDEEQIKRKIKYSRKVLHMRKTKEASFVGEDLDIIHKTSKSDKPDDKNSDSENAYGFLSKVDEENMPTEETTYKAESILREMLTLDSAYHGVPRYAFWIVGFRILLQVCCQFFENNMSFVFHWYEYLATIWYSLTLFYIYNANLFFVISGLADFKRKLFLMKILGSLISIDKNRDFVFSSYFPTINICCHKNLKSWLILREACLDIGKKYTYRIFLYCSVFLGFNLIFLGFLLMKTFRVVSWTLPISVSVTGTFDVFIILGVLFQMLRIGSKVNDCFDHHKGELIKIKKLLHEAKGDLKSYLLKDFSHCHFRHLFSKMLLTMQNSHRNRDFISEAIAQVDITIQDLDYAKETQPLKLMGFTASGQLITSIYTGVASIGFALVQFYLSGA